MNYYERIQKSIDYIEEHLTEEITLESCAREAYMSLSGYYRMFLSIVGYSVKEYIRRRRLSMAYQELQDSPSSTVLNLALKYSYRSADSFSRAFHKQFGILPSKARSTMTPIPLNFERISIMDTYFEIQDEEMIEKYPDIKVIKQLDNMKVACFTYFGPAPEDHAFAEIKKWLNKNKLSIKASGYRIFGYNNPDPSDCFDSDELYGYEVCVTVPDTLYETLEDVPSDFVLGNTYSQVYRKVLQGGKYAVMSVKRNAEGDIGENIMYAWQRFNKWLNEGKYIWGGHQYLEEHLGFSDEDDHIGGVELYMPIQEAQNFLLLEKKEETLSPCKVVMFHAEGTNGDAIADECWTKALNWAKKNQLDSTVCRIFQYNKGFDRRPPFFHNIMITLPLNIEISKNDLSKDMNIYEFPGGKYLTVNTDFSHLFETWKQFETWRKESKTKAGKHQWVEEWFLDNWSFPCKSIKIYYPLA